MKAPATPRWDKHTALVVQLATCVSFLSFLYYFQRGEILLFGDAVAHINIARRVFDSRTPGPLQLGTVWLPLPHVLMFPFLVSDLLWKTGFGGSIASLFAYVLGALGIFRLVRESYLSQSAQLVNGVAWIATAVYALNPSLIYLQATAMTEPLYLALLVWSMVYFSQFVRERSASPDPALRALIKCGACLAGACLTRYDGWFLCAVMVTAAAVVVGCRGFKSPAVRRSMIRFFLVCSAAPASWLAYNAMVYGNPLEFATGPYSARAIERRTASPQSPPHPGTRNLWVANSYFLKAAELNMMPGKGHRLWLVLLGAGVCTIPVFARRLWFLLLLLAPVPFYALSIAYGGVPIFLPPWWPFSIYNARYGVQLLPAFAVFTAAVIFHAVEAAKHGKGRATIFIAIIAFVIASYGSAWLGQPIAFREAWTNSRTRIPFESALAKELRRLPPNSSILMYLGDHVGALQQAGIPLRQVIYEGNHRTWKRPFDPDGLWERALANPRQHADFVVALEGDDVWSKVQKESLSPLVIVHSVGQPSATIYRTR